MLRAFAAAVVFALALRVAGFDAALGNDEAGTAVVGHAWLAGVGGDAGPYGAYFLDRPPLLVALYGLADIAGDAVGVRLLGAVCAVGVVVFAGLVARRVAGDRAGAWAALVAAPLASAATLLGDRTYGELVAAAFTTGAVLLLVHGRDRPGMLVGAGLLAAAGVLCKQSAFDALVAGTVFLAVAHRRSLRWWSVGIAAAAAATLTWAWLSPGGVQAAWEAVAGFRLDVAGGDGAARSHGTNSPLLLVAPLLASGLALALAVASLGIRALDRTHRVLVGAWLGAACLGVLGGGYYWGHYLLQLVAPASVAAGAWLGVRRVGVGAGIVGVLLALACAGPALRAHMPHSGRLDEDARAVGRAIAQRAGEGDTVEVLYARPGVVHASGLRSTSPYLWSAMQVLRAGEAERGIVARLGGDDPPTWVVRWNARHAYGFDEDGRISRFLAQRYRHVATVRGRELLRLA